VSFSEFLCLRLKRLDVALEEELTNIILGVLVLFSLSWYVRIFVTYYCICMSGLID